MRGSCSGWMGIVWLAQVLLVVPPAAAVQTSTWRQGGIDDFGRAESINVAIATDGTARLAPRREQLSDPGDAYVWCLTSGPDGTVYAGTGDRGLIVAVPPGGEPSILHDSIELQIQSLAVGPDSALYAGGSPDGVILRITGGKATTYFDTPESYVWDLEFGEDGALYAATGDRGRLYRITGPGEGEVYFDSAEFHLLTLLADGPELLIGTSPGGLVLSVVAPDSALVLYDAPEEEVKTLVRAADGGLLVGVVGSQSTRRTNGDEIQVRPAGGQSGAGAGAGVYRLHPDGAVQRFWDASEGLVLAIAARPEGGAWVGTGERGALIELDARGGATRLFATEESQVVALHPSASGLLLGTANPGRIHRVGPGVEDEGYLISEIFDARNVAAWGRLRWEGAAPPGTAIRLQTRSGNTERPDDTWSRWSVELRGPGGDVIPEPPARFIQWRARLIGSGSESPVLESVTLAYLERNLPPRLHGVDVVATPSAFDRADLNGAPDRVQQTLPTGVEVEFAYPRSPPRSVRLDRVGWLAGTRVASWVTEDPNEDVLLFDLYIKGEGERQWKLLAEELDEQIYAFQTADLDDGRYRVRVVASDHGSNPPGWELTDAIESRPFVVDNSVPRVAALRAQRQNGGDLLVTGEAVDSQSVIASLEYMLDGDRWLPVFPEDQIFDSQEERFRFVVEVEESLDEHTVVVRVADEAGNAVTRKVVVP